MQVGVVTKLRRGHAVGATILGEIDGLAYCRDQGKRDDDS
jgi:hypothetical protein